MRARSPANWIVWPLRLMPVSLRRVLDAWSYRIARDRAARRRAAAAR